MKTILFICTGNIFRSMIAEHALKAALPASAPYIVTSAGTGALAQAMYPPVRDRLVERGIDPSAHRQTKLTAEILTRAHLPVAMGLDHQEFVRTHFNRRISLFNRICFNQNTSIQDINEALPNWRTDPDAVQKYAVHIVDYIWNAIPTFIQNMDSYLRPIPEARRTLTPRPPLPQAGEEET